MKEEGRKKKGMDNGERKRCSKERECGGEEEEGNKNQ